MSGDQRYGSERGCTSTRWSCAAPSRSRRIGFPSRIGESCSARPDTATSRGSIAPARVIARFAERAFRRPVPPDEVERVLQIFRLAHDRGESYERAVQLALTTVLASPQFLFLVEPEDAREDRPLTEFELASRLSYFLWSSMPDDELFREARERNAAGQPPPAGRPDAGRPQVRPSSSRTSPASGCSSASWRGVTPDKDLFPGFDDTLRRAMRQETEQYFALHPAEQPQRAGAARLRLHVRERDAGAALWDRGRHGRRVPAG